MKCQLSDNDISNITYILHRTRKVIAQDEFDQLENTLASTNLFDNKIIKQGHDTLWIFCVKAIAQVFQEGNYQETRSIIEICLKLDGISREEQEVLERIKDRVLELADEVNKTQIAIYKAEIFALLENNDKAVSCLIEQKSQRKLPKKERIAIYFKLDELYCSLYDIDNIIRNMQELVIIEPRNLMTFQRLINSDFIFFDDIQDLAIEYLRKNSEKKSFWEALIAVYDWEFIAKAHMNLGYPFISIKAVLLDLLDAYKYISNQDAWVSLIRMIKENNLWDDDFEYKHALCWFSVHEYRHTEKIARELLKRDGSNNDYLLLLGTTLRLQEKYPEATRVLKKIDITTLRRDTVTGHLFFCYAVDKKEQKAKKLFDDRYSLGLPQNSFREIYNWIGNVSFSDELLFSCLENKRVIPRQKNENWREFDYFFRQIFEDSRDIENNGELKVKLLELHKTITALKKSLQLDYAVEDHVYHYSPITSIIPLTGFRESKPSRFQISNVSFMNDPGEGQAFTRILKEVADPQIVESIMDKLYGKDNTTYRKTYLSSFTLRRDFLPMWIQYADGGTGCCYKLSSKLFGSVDNSLEKQVTKFNRIRQRRKQNHPVLYQVFYYSDDKRQDPKISLCLKIAEILKSLDKYLKYNRIVTIVAGMLDEIRYLFKNSDYQTEEEVRIVCTDFEQEALLRLPATNDIPPKMYLELNVEFTIQEIILGPLVKNTKEWATYLRNCSNVNQVTVSGIQYR